MDHEKLAYAFGHLVGSHHSDAHSGDSADLAYEVFEELGLSEQTVEVIGILAEAVAGNYRWTGERP